MKTNNLSGFFLKLHRNILSKRAFRLEIALAVGLIITVILTLFTSVIEQHSIASKLVRLHITAESDSAEDQELKLAVRDRLLAELELQMNSVPTYDAAIAFFEDSLENIESIAKNEILLQGYDYNVNAELSTEQFPQREYGEITLPAGEYTTLRLTIGSGEGANWWCVMFPPLCSFASTDRTTCGYYSFSGSEWKTITGKTTGIKIKFKLLEIYSEVKSWFK